MAAVGGPGAGRVVAVGWKSNDRPVEGERPTQGRRWVGRSIYLYEIVINQRYEPVLAELRFSDQCKRLHYTVDRGLYKAPGAGRRSSDGQMGGGGRNVTQWTGGTRNVTQSTAR